MEMVHELIDAKIAKMRSDLDATIAAQRVLALAAKKPQGPKGPSNHKSKKEHEKPCEDQGGSQVAHGSEAQERVNV